ncbi:MAG: hypothetical protein DI584_08285 [Stenotrophomonas sp.]|nr:MAG: hypothetical protein DI584_08285 [Stenotrophomonas sp.]
MSIIPHLGFFAKCFTLMNAESGATPGSGRHLCDRKHRLATSLGALMRITPDKHLGAAFARVF